MRLVPNNSLPADCAPRPKENSNVVDLVPRRTFSINLFTTHNGMVLIDACVPQNIAHAFLAMLADL